MIALLELDLDDPGAQLPARPAPARVLVRLGPSVLGHVALPAGDPRGPLEVRAGIVRQLASRLVDHDLLVVPPTAPVATPTVSVVVSALGDATSLDACLAAIERSRTQPLEVVVAGRRDAGVAAAHGATFVRASAPGLAAARDAGWRAASGDVVAFVEDDRRVDERYVEAVAGGFLTPEIAAVTGVALPGQLATPMQRVLERLRPQATFRRSVLRAGDAGDALSVLRQRTVSTLAVRRAVLDAVDPAPMTGAGVAARPAADADLLLRVLAAGHPVLHEPDAVVRQLDPRAIREVLALLADEATATSTFLATQGARARTARRWAIQRWVKPPLRALRQRDLLLAGTALVGVGGHRPARAAS